MKNTTQVKVIVGITLGIVLLYIIFHPMLDRGSVLVKIHNRTPEPITVQFDDTEREETIIESGQTVKIPYDIRHTVDVSIDIRSSLTYVTKSVVLEEYVEPMYYGRIKVEVSFDEEDGKLMVKKDSWVTF